MRGGEHDAEIRVECLGEEGDRGRRQDAEANDVDTGAREAGDDGRLEELPACPRVTADDGLGAVPRERAHVTEDVGGRDGQVERKFGGEVAVRETSHAVGAEEPAQGASACCTGAPCGPSSGRTSCAP